MDIPATETTIATAEVLGQPADFLIEKKRVGDHVEIKVSTVLPPMAWNGRELLVWPAPRYPWPIP